MKKRLKKKIEARKQAPQQILELFEKAEKAFDKKPALANEYVRKARNLAMRYRLKIPRALKRRFCKHCNTFLKPGINCRIRTKAGRVVYYCLNCKKYTRIQIKK